MTQANFGRLLGPVATFSIFLTTKRPSPSTLYIKQSHVNTQHINSLGEKDASNIPNKAKYLRMYLKGKQNSFLKN